MCCGKSHHTFGMKLFRIFQNSHRFSVGQRTRLGLTKSVDDKIANVISVNVGTGTKTIVQLKDHSVKRRRLKYGGALPQKAILGLWNAIKSCSQNPKILQYKADQLKRKLMQRQFPASPNEVQEARRQIREALQTKGELPDLNTVTQKVEEAFEWEIKKKVDKILRHTKYNWKPLDFKTRDHAAIYTLARLAPNYAEVRFVLQEFEISKYVPKTVLDYGSGSGGAFWAAFEQWGNRVNSYQLVDTNEEISQFCMDILRGEGENDGHPFVHPDIVFRRFLAPSLNNTFDLVIAHRVLSEFDSIESRVEMLTELWKRTNKYLVLIDGSCKGGYDALMEARDLILMGGCELHREQTRKLLTEAGVMNDETECILTDQKLSNYIRYNLLKNKLPSNIVLPTRLEPGYVFAPCPHDQGCPRRVEKQNDVCRFSTKWNILRSDGRKQVLSTESGSFSYVIMAKGARPRSLPQSRLLMSKCGSGHISCTVCTPFCGIQRFTTSRSMEEIYKTFKNTKDGRLLPVEIRVLGSDSEYDVYDEAVEEYAKEKGSCLKM